MLKTGKRHTDKSKFSCSWMMLYLAVIFSVFSQISTIAAVTRPIMFLFWIAAIVVRSLHNKLRFHISKATLEYAAIYFTYALITVLVGMFDQNQLHDHLSANYLIVLLIPLVISVTAELFEYDHSRINNLSLLYLFCATVFAIWVNITYFNSYSSWLRTRSYLYESKNSAAQIWCSAILISVFFTSCKSKILRVIIYIACAYMLFVTGVAQCRTAILGMVVALVSYAVFRAKKKIWWLSAIAFFSVAVWLIPVTRQFLMQAMVLNKYAGTDLNTFSSGRIDFYKRAFSLFLTSPIVGVGEYYVDCSYLSILTESGIIGFILIERIWTGRILQCLSSSKLNPKGRVLLLMTVFYMIESLLEGFPPFGPGTSSFMYWLLGTMLLKQNRIMHQKRKTEMYL